MYEATKNVSYETNLHKVRRIEKNKMYENEISIPFKFHVNKKNVFIDWWFVEAGYGMPFWKSYQESHGTNPWFSPYGVELTFTKPKLSALPFLSEDLSGGLRAYSTLMYTDGTYRLWYETDGNLGIGDRGAVILYMESKDLIHWKRPDVGIFPDLPKNLLYGTGSAKTGGQIGAHGATVFYDANAPIDERYKMVHLGEAPENQTPSSWLFGATSPDGLKWQQLEYPILKHSSDTQTVIAYDTKLNKYILYARGWSPQNRYGSGGRRVIKQSISTDFNNFPTPKTIIAPESNWPPSLDIYTSAYNRWPDADNAHIMLPAIYDRNSDTLDIHLFVSRDGTNWSYPFKTPIISHESQTETSAFYAGVGLVPHNKNEWAFPVYYSPRGHNEYSGILQGMHIATIRQDGFICIEAKLQGEFYTYPSITEGTRILINSYSHPGGIIKAEIIEVKSGLNVEPLKGFTIDECDGITGDNFYKPMTWKGNDNLSILENKIFRIRFYLIRSKIFAFKFSV